MLREMQAKYDEQKHVLWVNVRQEPVLYINGAPYSIRSSDDVAGHLVINEAFEMNNLENAMASELKKSQTGEFSYFKDQVGEKAVEKTPPSVPAKGRADNVVTVRSVTYCYLYLLFEDTALSSHL